MTVTAAMTVNMSRRAGQERGPAPACDTTSLSPRGNYARAIELANQAAALAK